MRLLERSRDTRPSSGFSLDRAHARRPGSELQNTREPNAPLTILERGPETGYFQNPDDPSAAIWNRSISPAIVVEANDSLVGIDASEHGVTRIQAADRFRSIPPLRDVVAPLESWAAACDDRWLAERLREHLAIGGPWDHFVAAAMYAQLYRPRGTRTAAARARAFVRGEFDRHFLAPREWVRSQSAEQLQTIEDLAVTEIDIVAVMMRSLEADIDLEGDEWIDAWRSICHRRDDLASVIALLHQVGRGESIVEPLRRLDRGGRRLLFNLPAGSLAGDERLERVHAMDPTAWWAGGSLLSVTL